MTYEVILFPDVEALLISHLSERFPDTPISTVVPDPRPKRFMRLRIVGGNNLRINTDSTMVTFHCWEADSIKASQLARQARAYVHALAGESINDTWIYRVRDVGGPVSNPDPLTKEPRYQFTVSLDVKGEAITNEVQASTD